MILEIIFWVLLIDALAANYITWAGHKDYWNKMTFFKRFMPLTRGWRTWYLILVLFIGYLIF
jgi:hypothetical protein